MAIQVKIMESFVANGVAGGGLLHMCSLAGRYVNLRESRWLALEYRGRGPETEAGWDNQPGWK
jgi:hypothetical protein